MILCVDTDLVFLCSYNSHSVKEISHKNARTLTTNLNFKWNTLNYSRIEWNELSHSRCSQQTQKTHVRLRTSLNHSESLSDYFLSHVTDWLSEVLIQTTSYSKLRAHTSYAIVYIKWSFRFVSFFRNRKYRKFAWLTLTLHLGFGHLLCISLEF